MPPKTEESVIKTAQSRLDFLNQKDSTTTVVGHHQLLGGGQRGGIAGEKRPREEAAAASELQASNAEAEAFSRSLLTKNNPLMESAWNPSPDGEVVFDARMPSTWAHAPSAEALTQSLSPLCLADMVGA